jgi:putative ABC transport system permease protein
MSFKTEHFVHSWLYGVSPRDRLTIGGVAVLLTRVALTAGYLPARRTTGISPVSALRNE